MPNLNGTESLEMVADSPNTNWFVMVKGEGKG